MCDVGHCETDECEIKNKDDNCKCKEGYKRDDDKCKSKLFIIFW